MARIPNTPFSDQDSPMRNDTHPADGPNGPNPRYSPPMIADVMDFHQCFGHPILPTPNAPDTNRQVLRDKLLRDELTEWDLHHNTILMDWNRLGPVERLRALADFGDVIADLIYYLIGTALEYGLPLGQIWDAVQQANMSKLWTYAEISDGANGRLLPNQWGPGWSFSQVIGSRTGNHTLTPANARWFSVKDGAGKVRKPPSWKEPDIEGIVARAMHPQTEWSKTANTPPGHNEALQHKRTDPNAPPRTMRDPQSTDDGQP